MNTMVRQLHVYLYILSFWAVVVVSSCEKNKTSAQVPAVQLPDNAVQIPSHPKFFLCGQSRCQDAVVFRFYG